MSAAKPRQRADVRAPAKPAASRSGPQPRGRSVDAARRVAFDVLRAVAAKDAYANLALPAMLTERSITGRDAALATELTYGTLRRSGTLNQILDRCSSRPMRRVDVPVRVALLLGAEQLLWTRVPAHAAVSTSVDLAPRRSAGFVNAVLRRVGARDLDAWLGLLSEGLDPVQALALRYSHPEWIVQAFQDALAGSVSSGDVATEGKAPGVARELVAALEADNVAAGVQLAVLPGLDRDGLAAEVGGSAGDFSPYSIRLAGGAPSQLDAVRRGDAVVQDEGSSLVAAALAEAPVPGRDVRWLDLCAGPGGKARLLGALARDRGARLAAVDIHPRRAELVCRTTVGLPVDVVVADGTGSPWPDASFDRVLLDAPCTGLGALRRRPEARWRRQPSDVAELVAIQTRLLAAALRLVRPGGVVAYATCSPHLAETRGVLATVPGVGREGGAGARGLAVEPIEARQLLPGVPGLGDGPTVQLWPHRHGTDAMFLALLRRTA